MSEIKISIFLNIGNSILGKNPEKNFSYLHNPVLPEVNLIFQNQKLRAFKTFFLKTQNSSRTLERKSRTKNLTTTTFYILLN